MVQITKDEYGLTREEIIERIMDRISAERFEICLKEGLTDTQAIELDDKEKEYLEVLDDEELISEYNSRFLHPLRSYREKT